MKMTLTLNNISVDIEVVLERRPRYFPPRMKKTWRGVVLKNGSWEMTHVFSYDTLLVGGEKVGYIKFSPYSRWLRDVIVNSDEVKLVVKKEVLRKYGWFGVVVLNGRIRVIKYWTCAKLRGSKNIFMNVLFVDDSDEYLEELVVKKSDVAYVERIRHIDD